MQEMQALAGLFVLFSLLCLALLCLGLVYPPLLKPIIRGIHSRKWIGIRIGGAFIVLLVVTTFLIEKYVPAPKDEAQRSPVMHPTPTTVPTPTDAVGHLPLSRDEIQMQQAFEDTSGGTLNAKVRYLDYYMEITNNEKLKWELCDATIGYETAGDKYYSDFGEVLPNQTVQIPWSSFTMEDGTRFDFSRIQPRNIHLSCGVNGKTRTAVCHLTY